MFQHGGLSRTRLYSTLIFALVVMSFASIMIKLADAPAQIIAAWRLCIATLILTPWIMLRSRPQLRALKPHWPWVLLSGVMLAIHFATWIWSLSFTSVASSMVLVTTNPLFVGLGSYIFLKEKPSKALMTGIVISVLGGILIGYNDFQVSGMALFGDFLALMGALTASAYFLIGRRLRGKAELGPYIFLVYGVSAIILLIIALVSGDPLVGYSTETYLLFFLLAIGPQLIGHSTLNWSLRYLSAGAVAVATLSEPIGSSILAYYILGEPLTMTTILGGGLILVGVYFALRHEAIKT